MSEWKNPVPVKGKTILKRDIGVDDIACHLVRLWFTLCFVVMEVHVSCYLSCKQFVSKMLECGMLERDRQALRRRSAVLCKQLVVDEMLIQSLQADDILTESMAESIMVCEHWYMTYD